MRVPGRWAAGAAGVGGAALVLGVASGNGAACFAALDASWLFFAALSAGAVALGAAVRLAHGRWAGAALPVADAAARFFPVAFALLALLLLGARTFIPWTRGASALSLGGLALRQLVSAAVVFGLGTRLVRIVRAGADPHRVRAASLAYVLAYAAGLSLWAYDLVIELAEAPAYTVLPPYFFMGGFLSGLAWVALVAAVRGLSGPELRHDLGKLLFGFIIVWTYLLWSLFLPTWYGNVPEESAPLLARWTGAYRPIAAGVLLTVFAWPFWLLFSERLKRRRATLAAGAGAILVGLWAERFLLVVPAVGPKGGAAALAAAAGVTLGVAGLFLLRVLPALAGEPRATGAPPAG